MVEFDFKGVPESITVEQLTELLNTIGFTNTKDVREIIILPDAVKVNLFARDSEGKVIVTKNKTPEIETHWIVIKVEG